MLHAGEAEGLVVAVPVEEVGAGDAIRPAGRPRFYPSLEAEGLDADHVRVRWRCEACGRPVEAVTTFRVDELVARRR